MIARQGRFLAGLTAVSFLLFGLAHLPALQQAWWFFDDYSVSDVLTPGNVQHHMEQGRPGQMLWMLTFHADGAGDRTAANVALRLFQALLHCLAASLAALALWQVTGRRATLAAALPFLLWPHAGEAVLWRAAGEYPMAALLATAGVWVLGEGEPAPRRGLAGCLLLAAGVLSHQAAACAGLVVFLLRIGVEVLGPEVRSRAKVAWEGTWLATGYVMGGLLSVTVAWLLSQGNPERLRPADGFAGKLGFLLHANASFLASPLLYPRWYALTQIAAAALPFLVLAAVALAKRLPVRVTLAAGAMLASGFVAPYAAQLAVVDNQLSWRTLYLAPLAFAGGWACLDMLVRAPWARLACALPLAAILVADIPLARAASAPYPLLFQADKALVRRLEAEATQGGLTKICVVTPPDITPAHLNPHGLDFGHGGVKLSALLVGWSAPYVVRWFSHLEPLDDDEVREECVARCMALDETPGFKTARAERGPALCLCPP